MKNEELESGLFLLQFQSVVKTSAEHAMNPSCHSAWGSTEYWVLLPVQNTTILYKPEGDLMVEQLALHTS